MTTPRLLSDRYELGPALGYGGMSEVHGGRDVRLGRDVAIKVLRADLARDPQFQERFRREAQNAAALNHPAIVAVYDTGEADGAEIPLPYIVMEYVAGRTLRDLVRTEGPLDPWRVCEILADVCAALDFSHRHGIVHRDVKPANIMITPSGAVKVMDFGIARALSDAQPAVTQTAAVIGTAQYLSPEQARGESVDARSDVYATGCVLFELLTGRPPFTGDSPVAVAYQHVREEPPAPSELNPRVPPELDAITLKALAKNPASRYQSAAEMGADLMRVLHGEAPDAPMVMTAAQRTSLYGADGPQHGHGTAAYPAAGLAAGGAAAAAAHPEAPTGPAGSRDGWGWGGSPGAEPATAPGRDPRRGDDEQAGSTPGRRLGIVGLVLLALAVLVGSFWLFSPSRSVDIPDVSHQPQDVALRALTAAELRPTVASVPSEPDDRGKVVTTDPPSGTQVDKESVVTLRVGRGPDPVAVPQLVGMTPEQAQAAVEGAHLTLTAVPQQRDTTDPDQVGKVVAQDPSSGTPLLPGSPITLTIGRKPPTLKIPDVTGQDQGSATATLQGVGLKVSTTQVDGTGSPGTVVGTSPSAGTTVNSGATVVLQISRGNEIPVPSLTGQTTSQALATLTGAGFSGGSINRTDQAVSDPSQVGKVISQSPSAGSNAPRTSDISITVGTNATGASPTTGGAAPANPFPRGLFPGG